MQRSLALAEKNTRINGDRSAVHATEKSLLPSRERGSLPQLAELDSQQQTHFSGPTAQPEIEET